MKFNRVYHPVDKWEEISFGMWDTVTDKKRHLAEAIKFTGNHTLYGQYMMRVAKEWRYSCENALTDYALNQRAWIGHAACALAIRCPEDIVRTAWGKLSYEQQLLANEAADRAIRTWGRDYAKRKKIHQHMEGSLL